MSRRRASPSRSATAPETSAVSGTDSRPRPLERTAVLLALALLVATLAAYAPALRAGFIWDDDAYVTDNPTLRSLDGLRRIWLEPGATPQYYPLTFTSFWLEYRLFGLAPAGYHLTNVLLHAANAVLVWLILRGLRLPGAWLAAAIFALHPVHVESVAWITERKNVLSGLGYLAALLTALGIAARGDAGRLDRRSLAVVALFAAALLAKTVTCSLPVVLLVVRWWQRGRLARREVVATLPLFALGLALAAMTIWMERTHVGARGALFDLAPLDRVLIAGRALWFYAATLAWPSDLVFVYPRWTIDAGAVWQWLFPAAALAVAAAAWRARRRIGRGPSAALAGFAVTLMPALGFVDVYPMRYTFVADHYQYLASLFLIAPAAALLRVGAERAGAPAALLLIVPLVLAVLTWRQTHVYADQETLWRAVIARNPTASMAHINLGMWLHGQGRTVEAEAPLVEALRLEPADPEVHGDLGIVLAARGRSAEAHAHLAEAVRLAPGSALARTNLGNLLASAGRMDEALAEFRAAVGLDPRFADAQNGLANVLAERGETAEAIARYRDALAVDPGYVDAHYNLAVVLTRTGRTTEALPHFRSAVALAPRHAEAHRGLGAALAETGRVAEAVPHLAEAARLNPGKAETHYQLGMALAASGRADEAVAAFARAVDLRPDDADFHNDLGIAFAHRGDLDAAIAEFRTAVRLAPAHAEARDNLAAALARRGTPE